MAKVSVLGGTTSYTATVFIQDSTSTSGAGKTGLVFNTASLTAYYVRPGAVATVISLVTQTATGAYSSGGFVEIDATNMPGFYRLDVPNAVLAAGVKSAAVLLKGATGMAPLPLEFELTATDNQDATAGGISRIDAAISSRSTYAGGAVASVTGNVGGSVVGDVQGKVLGGGASALTGVGVQADLEQIAGAALGTHAAGMIPADLRDISGSAVSSTSAQLGVNVVNLAGTAATLDANNLLKVDVEDWKGAVAPAMTGDAFARLGAPAGASTAADIATVKADLDGGVLVSSAGADAILDRAAGVETGWTLRQSFRVMLSALAGKLSGAATSTVTTRDTADTKNRITATVDANGNRTAITLDPS